ncbi:hypothetical protein DRO24_04430 [Candidatus Bathyarchaeota archaeon]|nr:MAG: hypothetical protein DRO24_04430 [Candidatus Bathyarchaeota archaeon]
MKIHILVTDVGGTVGIGVVKALNLEREKFKIIVTDMNPASAGLYLHNLVDKSYYVPPINDPNYMTQLNNIIKREKINIIIPTSDPEVLFFAINDELFTGKGIKIAAPNKDIIYKFNDKWLTYKYLQELDIPTPYSVLPKDNNNLLKRISFPLIVKPRFSASSKGVHLVFSEDELLIILKHTSNPLIQEYIPGEEYTVGTLTDIDGKIVGILTMKRELIAGSTFRAITVKNSDIEEVIRNAIKKIGIKGPANFQLRISEKTGIPMIFEINPRFSSTTPFQARAGFNCPVLFCLNLMGENIKKFDEFKEGLVMMRYWEETYVEEKALLGPLSITCKQIEETSGAAWSNWFKNKPFNKKEEEK